MQSKTDIKFQNAIDNEILKIQNDLSSWVKEIQTFQDYKFIYKNKKYTGHLGYTAITSELSAQILTVQRKLFFYGSRTYKAGFVFNNLNKTSLMKFKHDSDQVHWGKLR